MAVLGHVETMAVEECIVAGLTADPKATAYCAAHVGILLGFPALEALLSASEGAARALEQLAVFTVLALGIRNCNTHYSSLCGDPHAELLYGN